MRLFIMLVVTFLCLYSSSLFATEDLVESASNVGIENDTKALIEKAREYTFKDMEAALHLAALAESKAEQEGALKLIFEINQFRGWCFENHNQLDSALVYYGRALENAIKEKNEKRQIQAYADLAVISLRKTDYSGSKNYRIQALEIAKRLNDKESLAVIYHGLGTLYREVADYEKSATYFLKSIDLSEEIGNKGNVINTLQFLATTYSEANLSEFALETIEKANQMALAFQDTVLMGIVAFDFGKILGKSKKYDKALEQFQTSLNFFEEVGHKPLIARSLLYLGDNFSNQGKYELAQIYFQKCLLLEPYISKKGLADLNYKLGDSFFAQGDLDKAKEYFESSLSIAEAQRFKDFCKKSNYKLYEIYFAENEVEKAIQHLQGYTKLKDDILNEEKAKKITELQFKYDSAKSEQEIQELQIEKNKLVQKGGFAIFAILFLFMFHSIWTFKKNNQQLKSKNEEIQKKNVKLRESNEVLKQFTYVAGHDLKEPLRNIGSFVSLIDRRYGEQLPGESREYMKYVLNGVHRMNGLLTSLLEYSTISIQKPLEKPVNSARVVHDVVVSMQDTIQQKKAVVECDASLPNIRMNDMHLTQLFQNLIGNSLKFSTENPKVKITGSVEDEELLFAVKDNGLGIDADHGDKIFKLFYKPDKGENANGTGIGLTICKNIVDKYNGRIWFEKNKDNGTTFHFAFPKELAA